MKSTKWDDWNPWHYLQFVLPPKRNQLVRDLEEMRSHAIEKGLDFHGINERAAAFCELALKTLIAALREDVPWTHDQKLLYERASRRFSNGDLSQLDFELGRRIESAAKSIPVLRGFWYWPPSMVVAIISGYEEIGPETVKKRSYYERARYPDPLSGQWSELRLAPHHPFAVGVGASVLAREIAGAFPNWRSVDD